MTKQPLSVIITNYNYAQYLPECIDSVLSQTYQPFEIIIADDASTDNSVAIIKAYEKKYPHVRGIYNKENMKLAKNKHNAIMQAKGEYIRPIDSDDYLYNNDVLEKEMALILKYEEQNQEIIAFSRKVLIDKNGNKIYSVDKDIYQGYILKEMLSRRSFIPRDIMMSKSQYLSVGGYDQGSKLYVDWCLKLKLAAKYEFRFTESEGAAFRKHGGGMSNANKSNSLKWQLFSFKKLLEILKGKEIIVASFWFYTYYYKRVVKAQIKKSSFVCYLARVAKS